VIHQDEDVVGPARITSGRQGTSSLTKLNINEITQISRWST